MYSLTFFNTGSWKWHTIYTAWLVWGVQEGEEGEEKDCGRGTEGETLDSSRHSSHNVLCVVWWYELQQKSRGAVMSSQWSTDVWMALVWCSPQDQRPSGPAVRSLHVCGVLYVWWWDVGAVCETQHRPLCLMSPLLFAFFLSQSWCVHVSGCVCLCICVHDFPEQKCARACMFVCAYVFVLCVCVS